MIVNFKYKGEIIIDSKLENKLKDKREYVEMKQFMNDLGYNINGCNFIKFFNYPIVKVLKEILLTKIQNQTNVFYYHPMTTLSKTSPYKRLNPFTQLEPINKWQVINFV